MFVTLDVGSISSPVYVPRRSFGKGARAQGRSQKKLMTEAMSMEDLWARQSVHGWVLFLGIKSVYNDYKQQK